MYPVIHKLLSLKSPFASLHQWISIVTVAHLINNDVCMNLWHHFLWLL